MCQGKKTTYNNIYYGGKHSEKYKQQNKRDLLELDIRAKAKKSGGFDCEI